MNFINLERNYFEELYRLCFFFAAGEERGGRIWEEDILITDAEELEILASSKDISED